MARNYDFRHIEEAINGCEDMLDLFEGISYEIRKETQNDMEEYTVTLYNGVYGSMCCEWLKLNVRQYAVTAYKDWNEYPWEPLNIDTADFFDTVRELYSLHCVRVRGYLEEPLSGLMESEEVNDWSEAYDLVWDWLHKGLFVLVKDDETAVVYSPEKLGEDTNGFEDLVLKCWGVEPCSL